LVTSALPLIGGNLTSALTLICVSGEEAPDLLKSSPTQGTKLRQLKLLAALIPVWLLLSPIFLILILRGEPWLLALFVVLGSTLSAAMLRLWNARPISLAGLLARQRQNAWGDILLGCLEMISLFTWMFVGFQAGQGNSNLAFEGLGAIAIMLTIAYWRSRVLGTSLGF
jgi:ABC-2 type transport system permease protein